MTTKVIPMGVYKAIARFERAVDRLAFRGSFPPEERPKIDAEYQAAKANLLTKIQSAL